MQAILALLARPFLDALLSAFGQFIIDALGAWRAHDDAVARGRADAERATLIAAEAARQRMEGVGHLTDAEVMQRLSEGKA
jgi:hypothetical protein